MTAAIAHTLRDPAALAAIAPEWNALVDRSDPDALFCRHEFLTENLRRHQTTARNAKPHIILLRRHGHLVAGLPLLLRRDRLGTGVLEWLDSKTPLYAALTGDLPASELATILQTELRRVPLLRKLKVNFVPAEGVLASALRALGAQETALAPRLLRDLSPQGLAGTVSPKRAKKLAQYHKRLGALGDLRIETVTDPKDMRTLSGWIMTRKRDWVLQRHGVETWATDPATAAFFENVSQTLAATGRAWGTALRLDGQLLCANLMFQQGTTVFWSKTAHDADYAALSPGWLALEHSLQTASERGARQLDMMMGSSYLKETLATSTGQISNFRLRLNPLGFLMPRR